MLQLDHIFYVSFLVFLLVSFPAHMIFVEINILKTLQRFEGPTERCS